MMPTVLICLCGAISFALLIHLWRRQSGSLLKKTVWSLLVCVPFIGWIFYGGFYTTPGDNGIGANGKASGWGSHWPRN